MWLKWPGEPLLFNDASDAVWVGATAAMFVFGTGTLCLLGLTGGKSTTQRAGLVVIAALAVGLYWTWTSSLCSAFVTPAYEIQSVPELAASDIGRLQEFKAAGIPAIFRQVVRCNPAVRLASTQNTAIQLTADQMAKQWSPAAISDCCGDADIYIQVGNVEQNATQLYRTTLGEFISKLDDAEWLDSNRKSNGGLPYYAESESLFEDDYGMTDNAKHLMKVLGLYDAGFVHYQALIWLGPNGTLTGLHADIDALNVLFQAYGSKTMWLYPPSQSRLLYASDKYDYGAYLSHVDPFHPDYERFPLFKEAQPIEVTVNAGDALFVPPQWYHFVKSNSVSVSISLRMFSMCESFALGSWIVLDKLHDWGLYHTHSCTCHTSGATGDSGAPY